MGCNKSNSKREVYMIKAYLRKQEKSQTNNLTFHLKELEKEEQTKPIRRRKEILHWPKSSFRVRWYRKTRTNFLANSIISTIAEINEIQTPKNK